MNARLDVRRRALRAQLSIRRSADRDTTKDRMMADAVVLDELLSNEFGSLTKASTWLFYGNGGRTAAKAYAERFKSAGVYVGLGGDK